MKKKGKVKNLLRILVILETVLVIVLLILIGKVVLQSQVDEQAAKKEEAMIKGEVVAETEDIPKEAEEKAMREKAEQEQKEAEAQAAANEQTDGPVNETAGNAVSSGVGNTDIAEIQTQLENLVNTEYGAGGTVSICVGRVDVGELALVGGGPMQAASLIKLYVAGCVYENYGLVSAYESYAGETEALIGNMIRVSDNDSCNQLVTRLGDGIAENGMALVNQYAANHGFTDTHMGRLMLQPNDVDDNYTSVRDCCNFLIMANAGQLEGGASILEYMKQQERRSKIPSGIPGGVIVGNKTGELSNVENDAAIVYGNNGTYVLCVMSENLLDTYQARQFISRTSGVVYEMMQ